MSTCIFKPLGRAIKTTLALVLLVISGTSLHAYAEASQALGTWVVQSQVPYQLNSISMISSCDGWAVGYVGVQGGMPYGSVLLHWDGSSWTRHTSPTSDPLYAVKMISSNDVWAVGASGARLHWDGSTWTDYSCGTVNCVDLWGLDFTSSSDVWAVGYTMFTLPLGKIEHWDGSGWTGSSLGNSYALRSVSAISANDAWVVGRYYVNSYTTYNAIVHWDGIIWKGTYYSGTTGLSSVDMLSSNDGWAVGSRYAYHYNGSIWEITPGYVEIRNSIEMLSTNDGWMVGADYIGDNQYSGTILHWDGSTWTPVNSPTTNILRSIDMISPAEGWAVATGDVILRYTNYMRVYLPMITR
jgi:hypothetical protein